MKDFYYESSSSHGVMTPEGKKIKKTNVKVENNKGMLTMSIKNNGTVHSDTRDLTEEEIHNIKNHKFMPNLFSSAITNIKNSAAKKSMKKHRRSKQDTRKLK